MTIHVFEYSVVPKLLSVFMTIEAITFGPLIFCRAEASDRLLRHETVHVHQYRELYYVGFLLLYAFYWVKGLVKYQELRLAYLAIPFELEARHGELDPAYLSKRKPHAWTEWRGSNRPDQW